MRKRAKKRVRLSLDERAANMLDNAALIITAVNKRKTTIGDVISCLVMNTRPDGWAAIREGLRK